MMGVSKSQTVMPGFIPGIHVLLSRGKEVVDGRNKSGHDVGSHVS